MRLKHSLVSRLFLLALVAALFMRLHWTQHFEHATVTTSTACNARLHAEQHQLDTTCLYQDLTLDTRFVTRQYVLRGADGTDITLSGRDMLGYSFSGDQQSFTWRTALVISAMVLFLVFAALP